MYFMLKLAELPGLFFTPAPRGVLPWRKLYLAYFCQFTLLCNTFDKRDPCAFTRKIDTLYISEWSFNFIL